MPRLTTYSDGRFIDFSQRAQHGAKPHPLTPRRWTRISACKQSYLHPFQIHLYHEKPRHLDDGLLLQHQLGPGPVEPDVFGWLRHRSTSGILLVRRRILRSLRRCRRTGWSHDLPRVLELRQ